MGGGLGGVKLGCMELGTSSVAEVANQSGNVREKNSRDRATSHGSAMENTLCPQ